MNLFKHKNKLSARELTHSAITNVCFDEKRDIMEHRLGLRSTHLTCPAHQPFMNAAIETYREKTGH